MVEEILKSELKREFDAIPPIEELKKMHTFSERHNKMMEALFAEVRRRERFERYFAAVKKVAMFALIILGLAVVSLKVVPTVYAYVESWITENADDRLIFKDKDTEEDSGEKEELRFELGYVPEGYELVTENVGKTGNNRISYKHQDGDILQLRYFSKASGRQMSIDKEGALIEEAVINGIKYYVFERDGGIIIVTWENEKYLFRLNGIFEETEMLDVATSVRVVEDK